MSKERQRRASQQEEELEPSVFIGRLMPSSRARRRAPRERGERETDDDGEKFACSTADAQRERQGDEAASTGECEADWSGSLLPVSSSLKSWAYRALETARGELRLAVDSVMEDLETLSGSPRVAPEESLSSPHDDESTRVDDLCTPTMTRGEYEQEQYVTSRAPRVDGFEVRFMPPTLHSPRENCLSPPILSPRS